MKRIPRRFSAFPAGYLFHIGEAAALPFKQKNLKEVTFLSNKRPFKTVILSGDLLGTPEPFRVRYNELGICFVVSVILPWGVPQGSVAGTSSF